MEMTDTSQQLDHQRFDLTWTGDKNRSNEPPHYVTTTSRIAERGSAHTGQEGLLHGLHETLQIVLDIIHHNVDFIHITAHDNLLQEKTINMKKQVRWLISIEL